MKKLIMILVIFVLTIPLFSQGTVIAVNEIIPEYLTVTLDSVTSRTIYVVFPHTSGTTSSKRTTIGPTALTSAVAQAKNRVFSATGDVYFAVVLDSLTRSDVDSLAFYIKPLIYDKTKLTWYEIEKDSTFLVLDTPGTYTSTSIDYLTWVHGKAYGCPLSGELWSTGGFALHTVRVSAGVSHADITAYTSFWIVR